MSSPFAERRARLEELFAQVSPEAPIHLTRVTRDPDEATDWFTRFEGAGLDGVVAKALASPYSPGKRTMIKVKHKRTAEAVVVGYRVHKSGQGVGSLLLGLVSPTGDLVNVGGISAFTAKRRLELVDELAPLVVRDASGQAVHAETDRSRFSSSKDVSFVPLRPERVTGTDLVVVRELTGGLYFGKPSRQWRERRGRAAVDTLIYREHEIERSRGSRSAWPGRGAAR